MLAVRLSRQKRDRAQGNVLCHGLGFNIRVRRATTASLGRPNDITPAGKPAIVQKMAPDFCWVVKSSKWRPMPCDTATTAVATLTQLQIYMRLVNLVIQPMLRVVI